MPIDTMLKIIYKCSVCGAVEVFSRELFMLDKKEAVLPGACGHCNLGIGRNKNHEISLRLRCFACEEDHVYMIPMQALGGKEPFWLACPSTRIALACVGNTETAGQGMAMFAQTDLWKIKLV